MAVVSTLFAVGADAQKDDRLERERYCNDAQCGVGAKCEEGYYCEVNGGGNCQCRTQSGPGESGGRLGETPKTPANAKDAKAAADAAAADAAAADAAAAAPNPDDAAPAPAPDAVPDELDIVDVIATEEPDIVDVIAPEELDDIVEFVIATEEPAAPAPEVAAAKPADAPGRK
eukprot:4734750-Pyramimonas_sp.AAC.1